MEILKPLRSNVAIAITEVDAGIHLIQESFSHAITAERIPFRRTLMGKLSDALQLLEEVRKELA